MAQAQAPNAALAQGMAQHLQLLHQQEQQQPQPASLADVSDAALLLCDQLAQHQNHINGVLGGQVPPLAADVDSLVAASELLSRRHTVLQNAMQALQADGADVSTVTPNMDVVAAGMAETGALLATLVAGAGACEAHREQQAGQHDSQAQMQEVQRLAQVWGALFPPAQNPAAAAAAGE